MPKKDKKPNCYKCKYRGEVVGSCHSTCKHPKIGGVAEELMPTMSILANKHRLQAIIPTGLNIKGNEHGIKSGWFNHPFNFDPIWLEECDGFKSKDKSITTIKKRLQSKKMEALIKDFIINYFPKKLEEARKRTGMKHVVPPIDNAISMAIVIFSRYLEKKGVIKK